MKVKIELTEQEIRDAIVKKIEEKTGLVVFKNFILVNGSVKYKKKWVRKEVRRFIASVEAYK